MDIKKGVIRDMRKARGRVEETSERVQAIRNDMSLSAEGKNEKTKEIIDQSWREVDGIVRENSEAVVARYESYNKKLKELLHVDESTKAARSATLQPIIQGIENNAEGFCNAYKKRFNDVAARQVLQETAESYLDIATTPERNKFSDAWGRVTNEVQALKTGEEKEIEGRVSEIQGTDNYVRQCAFCLQNDFDRLQNRRDAEGVGTSRTFAEHAIRQYEKAADQDE